MTNLEKVGRMVDFNFFFNNRQEKYLSIHLYYEKLQFQAKIQMKPFKINITFRNDIPYFVIISVWNKYKHNINDKISYMEK